MSETRWGQSWLQSGDPQGCAGHSVTGLVITLEMNEVEETELGRTSLHCT